MHANIVAIEVQKQFASANGSSVPSQHLILQSHSFHFNIGRRKTHAISQKKCSYHLFAGSDQKSKRRAKESICDQIPIYAKCKSATNFTLKPFGSNQFQVNKLLAHLVLLLFVRHNINHHITIMWNRMFRLFFLPQCNGQINELYIAIQAFYMLKLNPS